MEVFGSGGTLGFARDGSHAEYVEVPAEAVQPKPRALTFDQAAIFGIPYLTAWRAIVDAASLEESETVFITGTRASKNSNDDSRRQPVLLPNRRQPNGSWT